MLAVRPPTAERAPHDAADVDLRDGRLLRRGPDLGLRLGVAAAIAAAAAAAYAGSLRNGFVYDDVPQVLQNPWIRDPANLGAVFTHGAWDYVGTVSNYYRPVMQVVYMAVHAASGLDPATFHLANLLLHAAVSVLVLATAYALVAPAAASARRALAVSAGTALLFALHPIHTEAVSWVGGVPDLTAALFGLGSLVLYFTLPPGGAPSPSARYVLSVASFLAAALSKEIALVLPAVVVLHDIALGRNAGKPLRRVATWAPFAAAAALYLVLRWSALGAFAPVRRHAELTVPGIALEAAALFGGYLEKLVLPTGLTVFHEFHPVSSLADPRAIAGVTATLLFAAAGVALWRWSRRGFLAWSVIVLPLLPALYIPAVGENPFAERYLYLPSVGLAWLVALGAERLWAWRPRTAPALAAAAAIASVAFAWATAARQPIWKDEVALWTEAARRSPGAPVPHYNLALALHHAGRTAEAIPEYAAALRIEESPAAWSSLAVAYKEVGALDRAVAASQRAIALAPGYAAAYGNLGATLVDAGRYDAAVEALQTAVSIDPGFGAAFHNLGLAYERLGRRDDAIRSFAAALRIDPTNGGAAAHLERLGALAPATGAP